MGKNFIRNGLCIVLLAASAAFGAAACGQAEDDQGAAPEDDTTYGTSEIDTAEASEEAPASAFYCLNCCRQCVRPDGWLGAVYTRGTHNDCPGAAHDFCRDKWGYQA